MISPITRFTAILFFGLMLFGCATTGETYTNQDFVQASKQCYEQVHADQRARVPNWFTRYLDCSRARIMPIEIYAYRSETDVRAIYDEMSRIAPLVDTRAMSLKSAHEKWEQLKAEKLGVRCGIAMVPRGGVHRCMVLQVVKKQ